MTTRINDPLPFAAAPTGWRLAFGDPDHQDILVAHVMGWLSLPTGAKSSLDDFPLEPVILWENVKRPIVTTGLEFLRDNPDSYVHQLLPPGTEVRDVPAGWAVNHNNTQ
ncbi:hypothetical protein [Streptomyces sp. NPDC005548]|uniref:hypothetical protein n=1 Tax=Streptomyces sp. NPDC005548 TaxID=3364724 RepID=UPI00369BA426